MPENAEAMSMSPAPAVSCNGCHFAWNSNAMADGLRLLGSCPKCGGGLAFRDDAPEPERFTVSRESAAPAPAPHLVLGIPRR